MPDGLSRGATVRTTTRGIFAILKKCGLSALRCHETGAGGWNRMVCMGFFLGCGPLNVATFNVGKHKLGLYR